MVGHFYRLFHGRRWRLERSQAVILGLSGTAKIETLAQVERFPMAASV
jgi:hypothetical protein